MPLAALNALTLLVLLLRLSALAPVWGFAASRRPPSAMVEAACRHALTLAHACPYPAQILPNGTERNQAEGQKGIRRHIECFAHQMP